MSFSSEIKDELCKIRIRQADHQLAVLAGLTQTCGTLRLSRTPEIYYQSESESVISLISALASQLYDVDAEIGMKEQEHRQIPLSIVTLHGASCKNLLVDSGILSIGSEGLSFEKNIPDNLIRNEQTRKCFLRGIFLGSGSCSNPSRGYHLEMAARTGDFADSVAAMIVSFQLIARSTIRKGRPVVYLKGNEVSGFLALIGASSAALKLEDIRATKDYRNYINRTNNCETANIGKTVSAGLMQLQAIELIDERLGLSRLPAPLQEAALLRMQNPEATLQELADLAEIGKSGMNHRLSRLLSIANQYGDFSNG